MTTVKNERSILALMHGDLAIQASISQLTSTGISKSYIC